MLDGDSGDVEGNYGYGYALVELQRRDEGRVYLCKAMNDGSSKLANELRSIMANLEMGCE